MSTYTDKIGYTVRFGGPEGIQWMKNGGDSSSSHLNPLAPISGGPVGWVIEATKAAGLILQWWEMRQQTLLHAAQFEERRIPWLSDMLLQWSTEVKQGMVRLDTAIYFEREVSRLLDRVVETQLMDIPSSLLLQIERAARSMVSINRLLHDELKSSQTNFVIPDRELPRLLEYKPFWEIEHQKGGVKSYLDRVDQTINYLPGALIDMIAPFSLLAGLWKFAVWNNARLEAEKKHRVQEFHGLTAIALELRSLRAQLSFASLLEPRESFLEFPAQASPLTSPVPSAARAS
jgi:hypothetical protein